MPTPSLHNRAVVTPGSVPFSTGYYGLVRSVWSPKRSVAVLYFCPRVWRAVRAVGVHHLLTKVPALCPPVPGVGERHGLPAGRGKFYNRRQRSVINYTSRSGRANGAKINERVGNRRGVGTVLGAKTGVLWTGTGDETRDWTGAYHKVRGFILVRGGVGISISLKGLRDHIGEIELAKSG